MSASVKYLVTSQTELGMYTTETPEQAVAAFLRDKDFDGKVTVYVADYIGMYKPETRIARLPNPIPTKPDSPKAKAKG